MSKNGKYTACDSPECVRCHRYQQVREDAWNKLQCFADKHGWQGLDPLLLAIGEGKRYREVRCRLGGDRTTLMPLPLQNPNVLFVPTVRKTPWWEIIGDGPTEPLSQEKKLLEVNYDVILNEFNDIVKDIANTEDLNKGSSDGQPEVKLWTLNGTKNGQWCAFYLYNQGKKMTDSCARCPQTTRLIEGLPSVMTGSLFGNVSFSVIFPGTHIDEHYGPCNVRIRCHLGRFGKEKLCLLLNLLIW